MYIQKNMYPMQNYVSSLWETACSQINFPFFLMFCLGCCNHCVKSVRIRSYFWSVFSCIQFEYRQIRTRNNSVFGNFSRNEFSCKYNLRLVLGLNKPNNIIWNNRRPKRNYKIVSCSLKNLPLRGI